MQRLIAVAFIAASIPTACSADDAADKTPPDAASSVDTAANADSSPSVDTGAADVDDAGPAFDCAEGCDPFKVCGATFPLSLCSEL